MAYLETRAGRTRIVFKLDGRTYRHNLGEVESREADGCLARVEENLRLIGRGRLEIPEGADPALFLISDGRLATRPKTAEALSLDGLRKAFLEANEATLEANSLLTARIHFNHLTQTLGGTFDIRRLELTDLERHVTRRSKMDGLKGRKLNAVTIRKEVQTLSAAWNWASKRKLVDRPFPSTGLAYPKTTEKSPFRTRAEIESAIGRGIGRDEATALWESLFLTLDEVDEVLALVRERAAHPWIHPMLTIAAHTGMRRSEILRSQVADFDLAGGTALVREKKRAKGRLTTRRVPVSPFLTDVLRGWFEGEHPGGPWTVTLGAERMSWKARDACEAITTGEAQGHFAATLRGTRWDMIGFHTFRHSFASNCAARGVDERLIDAWMGHQTEAMRRRYRHLLRDQQSTAIRSVFGERKGQ